MGIKVKKLAIKKVTGAEHHTDCVSNLRTPKNSLRDKNSQKITNSSCIQQSNRTAWVTTPTPFYAREQHELLDAAAGLTQLQFGHYYCPVQSLAGEAFKACLASWKYRNIDLGFHFGYPTMNDELFHFVWTDLFEHLSTCVTSCMRDIVNRMPENVQKAMGIYYPSRTAGMGIMEFHVNSQIMFFKDVFRDVFRKHYSDRQQLKFWCDVCMININGVVQKEVWNSISEEIIDTLKLIFDKYLSLEDEHELKCGGVKERER